MIYILTTKEKENKSCMFTNDRSRCNVKNKVCDDSNAAFVISTLRLPERKQVGLTGTKSDE